MAAANSTGTTMDTPTQEKPTILIVQGSFQTPLVYEKLGKTLESLGYPTIHPPLPTCSSTDSPDFPKLTLVDDALAVRLELTRLIEYEGKPVMVVMHSYGGLVGSEAIPAELSHASRHAKNLPGGVIHLFHVAAFLLEEGQSVLSAFGESPNNDVKVDALEPAFWRICSPLFSPMAGSTSATARKRSATISRRPRPRCGHRGLLRSLTRCRLQS